MAFIKSSYYRLKTKVAHKLTDDRYVFRLVSPEKLDHRQVEGEVVHHFKHLDEIPDGILATLPRHAGATPEELAERFDLGLRMVVVMVGDTFGSMGWIRLGKDFRWILPVLANDRIINRGYTNPGLRGRGLYGRCNAALLREDFDGQANGGRVFCDCHISNHASIRQFVRAGAFEVVARVRPLTPRALDAFHARMGAPRT